MNIQEQESTDNTITGPIGQITLQLVALPSHTNASGDIYGGWLVANMDIAGGIAASARAEGRTATVAIDSMVFLRSVKIGDVISFYTQLESVGRSSLKIHVEAWINSLNGQRPVKLTEGRFTFVALDANGRTRLLPNTGA